MIPQEIKEQYAFQGTGFVDGKKRVHEFFSTNSNMGERVKFLKKEYGIGGFGGPCNKPMTLHGGDTYKKNGYHWLEWLDENMENQNGFMPLSELVNTIQLLIDNDSYFERKKTVKYEQMDILQILGSEVKR